VIPSGASGQRVLLAAGTKTYRYGADFAEHLTDLNQVPDALRCIAETLTGLGYESGLPGARKYLINPSLQRLKGAVRTAASSAPVVVVYYTGHGLKPDRSPYYLVTTGARPGRLGDTALEARQFVDLVFRRDARDDAVPYDEQPQVLVILDCCFSGVGGMEALKESLQGMGNPKVWVLATASSVEYARQGLFAATFCDALQQPTTGPSTEFLSLDSIIQAVNDTLFSQAEQMARVFPPGTGSTGIPPFFPNKDYRPGLEGLTVSEQHWLSRLRGAPLKSTTGFYLTGRTGRIRAAEDLARWMTGPGHDGLAVVTGSPGTGKSALLALPVLLAQSSWREDLLGVAEPGSLIQRTAALLPADAPIAAVHARGFETDEVARVIAQALGRYRGTASALLEDLHATPERGDGVIVVDAIDEANSPDTLLTSLLLPLARRRGMKVAVGTRRHVLSGLAEAQLTIDLDSPRYHDPQALTVYIHQLLLASEELGITTPYQGDGEQTAAAVAAAIAQRAISGDRKTESFLIGRFLALSVRSRTEPVDIASPDWQSELPAELKEAFDEDLARLGERTWLARTLLEALAWAKGPGLPWENIWVPVARALAGHKPGQRLITNRDVRWLLEQAGAYIVEDRGPGQRSVYRPFHELLAAHLRGEPLTKEQVSVESAVADTWQRHIVRIEKTVTHALMETVPTSKRGRDWMSAHPYVRTYLAQHAAAARIEFSAVVQDTDFLAAAAWVTLPSPSPLPEPDLDALGDEQIRLLRQSTAALEDLMDSLAELDYVSLRSADYAYVSARMRRSLNQVNKQLERLVNVTAWPDRTWALEFTAAMAQVRRDLQAVEMQWSLADISKRNLQLRRSVATLRRLLTDRYPSVFKR
jgi:hypothetical protein